MIKGLAVLKERTRGKKDSDIIHIVSYPNAAPNRFEGLYDFYKNHSIIKVELDPNNSILDYVSNQPTGNGRVVPDVHSNNGYRLLRIKKIGDNLSFLETSRNKTVIYNYLQYKFSFSKDENIRLFYIHSEKKFLTVEVDMKELLDIRKKITKSKFLKDDKILIYDSAKNLQEVEVYDLSTFVIKELERKNKDGSPFTCILEQLLTRVLNMEYDAHFFNMYRYLW